MKKPKSLLNPWVICGISLSLVTGFSLIASQFYKLQILEHNIWAKRADMQQQTHIDLGAKRGSVFVQMSSCDTQEYVPLVQDAESFHLYVDAQAIPQGYKKMLAAWLAPLIDKDELFLNEEFSKSSRFRKLEWYLDVEKKRFIENGFKKFIKKKPIPKNALFFLPGYKRVYPLGSLAGSLVHTLGTQEGARGPERVPTGGLEKRLDSFLKGSTGQLVSYRTPKGRLDSTNIIKKPSCGCDVYLSINPLIQTIVEDELVKAVAKAKAKGGWAVVMDPYSGKVLAMAQEPSLNLLNPQELLQDPVKSTYSNLKALTDPFEPGSIIKPITMLTCLKANRVLALQNKKPSFDPEEKVACLDGRFPGRKNPIKDVHPYSYLNMNMALQKSSNVYMAKAICKMQASLGDMFYSSELKNTFGFGKKTSLGIGPESSGFVPTPLRKTAMGLLEWSLPTPYSLSMGYNLLVTTMQMARVFSIIANGGSDVQPTIINKIVKKNDVGLDDVLYEYGLGKDLKSQLIHPSDAKMIKHAMQFAGNKGGTAFRAKIPGFTACLKTATTEKLQGGSYSKDKHISTIAGFAPMNDPKFVCIVVIDEPGKFYIEGVGKNQYGGVCAAPSFSVIGQKVLEILGVPFDDPQSLENANMSVTYKDVKNLEDLFKQWNH